MQVTSIQAVLFVLFCFVLFVWLVAPCEPTVVLSGRSASTVCDKADSKQCDPSMLALSGRPLMPKMKRTW